MWTTDMTSDLHYCRSSFCGENSCVEVAALPDGGVAVRRSNDDRPGLTYTATEWQAFVRGVKAGEFD